MTASTAPVIPSDFNVPVSETLTHGSPAAQEEATSQGGLGHKRGREEFESDEEVSDDTNASFRQTGFGLKKRRHSGDVMLEGSNGVKQVAPQAGNGAVTSISTLKSMTTNGNGDSTMSGHAEVQNENIPAILRPKTFYGHDREEVTRILIQGLNDMGYESSAQALSRESGFDLETPFASAFRLAILEGDWEEAENLIQNAQGGYRENEAYPTQSREDVSGTSSKKALLLADNTSVEEMLFRIREQKYLELLENRDLSRALMVLREELQPLQQDEAHLHALSG